MRILVAEPLSEEAERHQLLNENLAQVHYIARRIHGRLPSHVTLDDLVHAGILGLIDAVDKFDSSKNVQLKSYARFRIRGAILDNLRQMDWGPRSLRRQARRIEAVRHELAGELGHVPSETEIAARLGIALEKFQQLLGEIRGLDLGSLQAQTDHGASGQSIFFVPNRAEDDPFQLALRGEMRTLLAHAIEELDEKERQVLGLYYLEELTMKEVAVILDVGESRVSQIHTAALIRLRSKLQRQISTSMGSPASGSLFLKSKSQKYRAQHQL